MPNLLTITMNPAVDISTTIDEVISQKKMRCSAPNYDPGGGGINVARVVKRLGWEDAIAFFPLGGSSGAFLQDLLRQEPIPCHTVPVQARTRENFSVDELSTRKQFRFVLPGPQFLEEEWRACLDAISSMIAKFEFVVVSGSLPLGIPDDFYARIARLAKKSKARLILDTSGNALREALREGVYLVKPNHRELDFLAKTEGEDPETLARHLVASGKSRMVMHTLGEKGAVLVTSDGEWRWKPPAITIKSAIGAGDSFLGAAVFALMRGDSPVEACRLGVAAAAATLLSPGTQLCRSEDVWRLYEEVTPWH